MLMNVGYFQRHRTTAAITLVLLTLIYLIIHRHYHPFVCRSKVEAASHSLLNKTNGPQKLLVTELTGDTKVTCPILPPDPAKALKEELSEYPRLIVETECRSYIRTSSLGAPADFDIYVHLPREDQWTSEEILTKGTWHQYMCKRMMGTIETIRADYKAQNITSNIRFLDVGANIGYLTLWMASAGPDVEVLSVEPHPSHNKLLEMSLKANPDIAKRVSLHKVALSTDDELGSVLCMRVHPENAAQTFIDRSITTPSHQLLPCTYVLSTTLDTLLSQLPTQTIDIIKMDVEGFEINVLAGGMSLFRNNSTPPRIIISEYNPELLSNSAKGRDPVEWLMEMYEFGYTVVEDFATNKKVEGVENIRTYFGKDFLKHVPSGHTDIVFVHNGKRIDSTI
ncbi:hypothetical protein HK097_005283 [Rhizophlyctis rosea]|uniref:Methyltransferase FkbM domain-containing protein n=1 Tax=Rhizophlyctis rosea TaxID=64517 RepID=A0AAD5SED8_9FUNG|nr:hypothetical protein HK097_005283 [Rhizophlyctis rosea]